MRSSFVLDARDEGLPVCVHWGARLPDDTDLDVLADLVRRPLPPAFLDVDVPLSVMPEVGHGFFGYPAIAGSRPDGRKWETRFLVERIETDGSCLTVRAADAVAGLSLALTFRMRDGGDVLERSCVLINDGPDGFRVDWVASGSFALPPSCNEMLGFEGAWTQEFRETRASLGIGVWLRENRRGHTSHDVFPGLVVGEAGFGEARGEVFGFHLGWSGNHRLLVELQNDGRRQVQLGELLAPGEIVLAPGASHATPTVYAAWAPDGLNGLSRDFHRHVRTHVLAWPGGAMRPRPVHFNTWEANYFEHDLDRLKAQADAAAAVGAERFVLDDGWFRGRNDARAGLGDWVPDPAKYPKGLGPLVEHVLSRGLEFGLWVEPEMVNPDSDLFRAHPDWVLATEGRPHLTARHQLVLDLTLPEVSEYLFAALDRLLRDYAISYLKWDMNRNLTEAGSGGVAAFHRQTRAVYALIDRLRAAHPAVEIESCASGGGRIDFEILKRTHRFWTSDSNDALDRQSIQRGFGRFFPPEVMGAHIGPAPAHTTGRSHDLSFRAATALFGHLGLELDLLALSEAERRELAGHIAFHKQVRGLLHGGTPVRVDDPEAGRLVHGVATDTGDALFAVVQTDSPRFRLPTPVRLPLGAGRYRVRIVGPRPPHLNLGTGALRALGEEGIVVDGATLALAGLQLPRLFPESALLLRVDRL